MEATNLLEWVADTSFPMVFFILGGPALLLSVMGILLIRAVYPVEERTSGELVSVKINYMAETYAVVLGLFLVGAFNDYQGMQSTVKTEAFSLRALHALAIELPIELPTAETGNIPEQIRFYTRTVIGEEWPLQKFGEESVAAQRTLDRIFALIAAAGRVSDGDRGLAIQAEQLAQGVLVQRAQRLSNGPGDGDILSGSFSNFLVILTFIAIAIPWFVYNPSPILHVLLGGALLLAFMSIIVLAVKMLYPFAGELAIRPTDFEAALIAMLEQAQNAGAVP